MFDWVIAARLPTVMVAMATPMVKACHSTRRGHNPMNRMRIINAKEATFGATEMKAVIEVGAPSYASGVHWWKGTAAILKNIPANKVMRATQDNGSDAGRSRRRSAMMLNLVEPPIP